MATRKRALLEPTDDWQQLQFQLDWPEQTRYELIRPQALVLRLIPSYLRATRQTPSTLPLHIAALARADRATEPSG